MGRVFTFAELAGGKVPKPADFLEVLETVKRRIGISPAFVGGIVLGSVPRGEYTVRSDLDIFVLYREMMRTEAIGILRGLVAYASVFHVPLKFIPLDDSRAGHRDRHRLESTFLEHLRMCVENGWFIKSDPLVNVNGNGMGSFVTDARSYLLHKIDKFEKGEVGTLALSEESFCDLLGDAISFASSVARKMISCNGVSFPNGDSKSEVARIFSERNGFSSGKELFDAFDRLRGRERYYQEELFALLERPEAIMRNGYSAILRNTGSAVSLAAGFGRLNLNLLSEMASPL